MAQVAVEAVGQRAKVFVHMGASSTAETLGLAQHARQIGADAVAAVTPYYFAYRTHSGRVGLRPTGWAQGRTATAKGQDISA